MLLTVKRFISGVVANFFDRFYFNKFKRYLKSIEDTSETLVIFDLDNTLAHTYPQLVQENKIEMYKSLPQHKNMVAIAKKTVNSSVASIILTARDYKYTNATKYWVSHNLSKDIPIFMVSSAKLKLKYLEMAVKSIKEITYYDDLSYNHEKGEVKFYDKVITQLKSMPIDYVGYDAINQINSN